MTAVQHEDPIIVSGVAAVTPVGHSAPVSYTSIRAGLSRIADVAELQIRDQRGKRMQVACAAVSGISDGQRRYLRHYRLAVRAFAEVLAHANLDARALDDTAVFLALSEPERPGMDDRLKTDLMRKISRTLGLPDLTPRTSTISAGHAGPFGALHAATQAIIAGHCRRAIIGSVDGYLDELTMQWLYDTGRLRSEDNSKGFVPGEAAAFLVIERQSASVERRGRVLARVTGLGAAIEAHNMYGTSPSTGEGLASVIRSALASASPHAALPLVICDLNGERYRANEWGLVLARGVLASPPQGLWHPADCLGDCGAAAGALSLVLASLAIARQDVAGGPVLAWGSSDDGERGAAVLDAAFAPH